MTQDVAILLYEYNTIATKPVSGPVLGEKDNHNKDPVSPGHAPYDFDTGIIEGERTRVEGQMLGGVFSCALPVIFGITELVHVYEY